jgi:hypothetical protein
MLGTLQKDDPEIIRLFPDGLPAYLAATGTSYARLFDRVQAAVPGLGAAALYLACWDTIEDFYHRSTYKREHVYWEMPPGVATVNFDPYDADWRVCLFLAMQGLSNWKIETPGLLRDLTSPTPCNLRRGEVLLALKPRDIQVQLGYHVWTERFETLFHGVMYRLYQQPGKPWSDLKSMNFHGLEYRAGIASARAEAQAWRLRDAASWSFPYYATGGHPNGRGYPWGTVK